MIHRLIQSTPLVGLIRIFASLAFAGIICLFVLYNWTPSSSFQSVCTLFPISRHHFNDRKILSFASQYYNINDNSMGEGYRFIKVMVREAQKKCVVCSCASSMGFNDTGFLPRLLSFSHTQQDDGGEDHIT